MTIQSKFKCSLIVLPIFVLIFGFSSSAFLSTRQTRGIYWDGAVEMKKFTRRVTVHPYFLDIEEDIEIAPFNWRPPSDNLNTLEIYGQFTLPAQSVITGILIWYEGKILKGKIKGKETARKQYEDVVDRETAPPPRPRDPILIEKISSSGNIDRYNLSIYPVEWGKSRKIRIRYLCPQRYINNDLMMQIPSSITTEVSKYPQEISQTIRAYGNIERINIISPRDTISTSLPVSLDDIYNRYKLASTYIQIAESQKSMMVKTSFDDGNWKGNYLMYWGAPPESLLIKAGLKREIVFLWKWNFQHSFVYNDNSQKSISPYGIEVINQARRIYNSNIEIADAGDKVGLLLEKGNPDINKMFPLSNKNTAIFDSLQDFLSSIDSTYLLSHIRGAAPPVKIRIDENERENFFRKNTEAFDISLKLICSLFSDHEKILKHIVFISAGPVPEMPNLEDYYMNSDSVLSDSISVSAYGSSPRYPTGYWPGVPMHKIIENHALMTEGTYSNDFWIPEKRQAHFSATVKSEKNSYETNLIEIQNRYSGCNYYYCSKNYYDTLSVDTMFFAGHSVTDWHDAIDWKAFDTQNNELATYSEIPFTINSPSDTFCAKLWAGTNHPVSDTTYILNRGARYGIIDEQYSLLALEQDTVSADQKALLENEELPFLSNDEIFLPDLTEENPSTSISAKAQSIHIHSFAFITYCNGSFKLLIPSKEKVKSVKIYDLKGRLVHQLSINDFNSINIITFQNHGILGMGMYAVVVETDLNRYVKNFQII
ncbi:MAG: T9SS type A sorting domain-containing protein [Chitinivibrionales bacterium]|nr:T9SS type A sorting domain-containing protein [Chitinivibrionales bacterium]